MPFPFEVGFDDLQADLDAHVDAVFGRLESEFLVMPKGNGFSISLRSAWRSNRRAGPGSRWSPVSPDEASASGGKT